MIFLSSHRYALFYIIGDSRYLWLDLQPIKPQLCKFYITLELQLFAFITNCSKLQILATKYAINDNVDICHVIS